MITLQTVKKNSRMRLFRLKRRRYVKNGLNQIPNLFTLGNAFFGFCSLILAAHGEYVMAAYFILLGALLDALDGRMARLMGISSPFGMQLDSLCDAVSFIVAPAFLAYAAELKTFGVIGFIASSIFVLSGIARLARFNITNEEQTIFFLGVPSTLAGCFLATLLIIMQNKQTSSFLSFNLPFIVILLAYLMISTLRFPTFKHLSKKSYIWGSIFITGFIISMGLIQVLFSLFLLYFLLSFSRIIHTKITKKTTFSFFYKK